MNIYSVHLVDLDEWVLRVRANNQREARAEALRVAAELDNPDAHVQRIEKVGEVRALEE